MSSYRDAAARIWTEAEWVTGDGRWASVSNCPPATTVMLHPDEATAREAWIQINRFGCGGQCAGDHNLVDLYDHSVEFDYWPPKTTEPRLGFVLILQSGRRVTHIGDGDLLAAYAEAVRDDAIRASIRADEDPISGDVDMEIGGLWVFVDGWPEDWYQPGADETLAEIADYIDGVRSKYEENEAIPFTPIGLNNRLRGKLNRGSDSA